MEITHELKLSSGKVIKLTDDEFKEIKEQFTEVVMRPYQPITIPQSPSVPNPYEPWITWSSCAFDTDTGQLVLNDFGNIGTS